MQPHRMRLAFLSLLLYFAATLVLTWPMPAHILTHVIGPGKGDNYEYLWKLWWIPHAILDQHVSPFFQPDIYYPHGYPLSYGEITPIHTFLMMPLTLLIGEIASYNSIMLLSTVLSAWSVYLLTTRWLKSITPDETLRFICSFLAGCSFGFSANQLLRIGGHLPLVDTQWLVFALLGLDRWLDSRQLRDALIMGIAITLAALSSWYYAFMLVIILPVYLLTDKRNSLKFLIKQRSTWLSFGVVLIVVGALCTPFIIPYLQLARDGSTVVPLSSASFWAASPFDYLVPNPRQPLWQHISQFVLWPFSTDAPAEFMTSSIGTVTLLLGLLGWTHLRGNPWRSLRWVILVAFILSLGPYLHISRLPTDIPLPDMILIKLIPTASGIRSWGRFSIFVLLGMSLFAGAGIANWYKEHRHNKLIAVCFCGLLLFTLWQGPMSIVPVEPRSVDKWLAQQPGDFSIMQYPISVALSGPSMFYTRYHGKRVVFGYGTYLPFYYEEEHPALSAFPANIALDQLKDWDVKYILVQAPDIDPITLNEIDKQSRLRHVITLDGQIVYELVN